MDFTLSGQQRDRCASVLARMGRWPATAHTAYTRHEWSRLAALGLLGASVPTAEGGGGLGALDTALVFESAGRGCADTGI
ncbi:acyl-CoA dehydrogenase family protein, partial [Streptomyces sp. 2MCAF27]